MSTCSGGRRIRSQLFLHAWLLAAVGVAMVLVGIYFIFLRPPLLPEDVRYLTVSTAQLLAVAPRLMLWLRWIFTVLGGYIAATGVLFVYLAVGAFAERKRYAIVVALVAGAFSVGMMSVVNLIIDSDFKQALLVLTAMWGAALVCACRGKAAHLS
ncbi:hypothetical protein [Burkholderia pseudomallei]|uniref:hypothetical protein n=1 Tax=Burkholderia pseudomallei TaxID=28450 RepID=UPI000F096EB9|nr:hypothetical protein [Burkholderia pseudomallei]VCJ27935.1 Uncharacterised protein [Burkholderia pseudomallei]VCJ28982.1 Uncharacterised protein [Burkholderia pseudomallei]